MTEPELPQDPFPPTATMLRYAEDGTVVVGVEVIPLNLDDPITAVWCDECRLPSALSYRFRVLANGIPLPTLLDLSACIDCGSTWRND